MEREFWLQRWQQPTQGFQQQEVNPYLQSYWSSLHQVSTVLVPLCGSSIDMYWLMQQGVRVVGVEFSRTACKQFFKQYQLAYDIEEGERFRYYRHPEICLIEGDFFDLRAQDLAAVDGVYDRAALVALPEGLRQRYADNMERLLPRKTQILLVTMDYDQDKMKGPPFSVNEAEVRRLFTPSFLVSKLATPTETEIADNLAERGLDAAVDNVYLLSRR